MEKNRWYSLHVQKHNENLVPLKGYLIVRHFQYYGDKFKEHGYQSREAGFEFLFHNYLVRCKSFILPHPQFFTPQMRPSGLPVRAFTGHMREQVSVLCSVSFSALEKSDSAILPSN